jgi:hypothetical protein
MTIKKLIDNPVTNKLREWATVYLLELMAAGTLAFVGLMFSITNTNAAQDARLKNQEDQMLLLRSENRDDHKVIQRTLNTILMRSNRDASSAAASSADNGTN